MNLLARSALAGHLGTMAFGLAGLTVAMRYPSLWSNSEVAVEVYKFGTQYAGAVQIVLAAVAMFAYGVARVGVRRTTLFFVCATALSLASELIGTGTGWPFGNYSYTSGLGFKLLDRVPFTIPLSWFYMGLASYLVGIELFRTLRGRVGIAARLLAGVWLLVVWDLVLDPAMAHESLSARFWIWHETGPYFGMPLQNFAGWAVTALAFMGLSRYWWGGEPRWDPAPVFAVVVYQANLAFASVLCASVGLWTPIGLGLIAGALPAALVLVRAKRRLPDTGQVRQRSNRAVDKVLRLGARAILRGWQLRAAGVESMPTSGPMLLAVQHVHHLYDACALLAVSKRPLRFLVALDWVRTPWQRAVMERLCHWAGWPTILRPQRYRLPEPPAVYTREEVPRYLLRGLRQALELLEREQVLVVFPEGFPKVDPHTPGARDQLGDAFQLGVVWLAQQAARRIGYPVPVVPVGIRYDISERASIMIRFGTPVAVSDTTDLEPVRAAIERQARALSAREAERMTPFAVVPSEEGNL